MAFKDSVSQTRSGGRSARGQELVAENAEFDLQHPHAAVADGGDVERGDGLRPVHRAMQGDMSRHEAGCPSAERVERPRIGSSLVGVEDRPPAPAPEVEQRGGGRCVALGGIGHADRLCDDTALPRVPDAGFVHHDRIGASELRRFAQDLERLILQGEVEVRAVTRPPLPSRAPSRTNEPVLKTPEPREPALTWIEVVVLDLAGRPLRGQVYKIKLPDGSTRSGALDGDGKLYVNDIPESGMCQLDLPGLGDDEWTVGFYQ